jgi:low temperature requirement protein LtrA
MPVMIVLELLSATTPEELASLGIRFLTIFGALRLGQSSKLPAVDRLGQKGRIREGRRREGMM